MAMFRIKAGGETYELDKLTLGDARALKLHYGVMIGADTSFDDPDVIGGLLYLCLRKAHPAWEHDRVMNTVDAIDMQSFEAPDPVEPDPTPASAVAAGV